MTYPELIAQLNKRGLAMAIKNSNTSTAPFPLKDAMAANEELRDVSAKIASGEIQLNAPCNGMIREWTEVEKVTLNSALAEAFGWKK